MGMFFFSRVCYLAGRLARRLRENGADISDAEISCVEIAGLCHELGQGPFSHVFEHIVRETTEKEWTVRARLK